MLTASSYAPVQLHTPTTVTATHAATHQAAAFSIDDDSTLSTALDSEQAAVKSSVMLPQRTGEVGKQVVMLRVVSMYDGDNNVIVDAGSINGGAARRKPHGGDIGGHNGTADAWGTQLCISALSAISGFLFGYDLCVMVIALPLIQAVRSCVCVYTCSSKSSLTCVAYVLSCALCVYTKWQEFELSTPYAESVVSVLMLGAVVGSLLGGVGADWCVHGLTQSTWYTHSSSHNIFLDIYNRIGRKPAIVVTALFFLLGSLLMTFAVSYATMLLGRFLAGLAVGASGPCVSVYLSEIARPDRRGALVTINEVRLNVFSE